MEDYIMGDSCNAECPYCGHSNDVTGCEVYDDDVEIECDKCKKEFICWGEQSYTYYSKKIDALVSGGDE